MRFAVVNDGPNVFSEQVDMVNVTVPPNGVMFVDRAIAQRLLGRFWQVVKFVPEDVGARIEDGLSEPGAEPRDVFMAEPAIQFINQRREAFGSGHGFSSSGQMNPADCRPPTLDEIVAHSEPDVPAEEPSGDGG